MQSKSFVFNSGDRNNNAINGYKYQMSGLDNSPLKQTNNEMDDSKADDIFFALLNDPEFDTKYARKSLFLVGAGAFGCVFRAVTQASGKADNPMYPKKLVRHLQRMKNRHERTRAALLDDYRQDHCLDLVAIKFEAVTQEDFKQNAIGKINLIREFLILYELFHKQDSRYSLVGIPMPIDFGYTGSQKPDESLKNVIVYDKFGNQDSFHDLYCNKHNVPGIEDKDVTLLSYMSMELLGPNLDEFKQHFAVEGKPMYFSVQTTFKLMDQVLCRLLVLHRNNMVHLDLKPDNICVGLGKMANTIYILDFGLSRVCSKSKPDCLVGSRRYMSLGVTNYLSPNYMMDLESWFYVFIVLLTDYIPWSDEELSKLLPKDKKVGGSREDELQKLVPLTKKHFWNENEINDKSVLTSVIQRIEKYHKDEVPDIGKIMMDLYEHLKRMRSEFYEVDNSKMLADIKDEESDLFKRYKSIRKQLLHIYDCDFNGKDCSFANDKEMHRRVEERRSSRHPMLVYAVNGRDWKWDWDQWFDERHENDTER